MVTVTHTKTNTIADWTQADLDAQIALGNFAAGTVLADIVIPSDWNDDHTIVGAVESHSTLTDMPSGSNTDHDGRYPSSVTGVGTYIDLASGVLTVDQITEGDITLIDVTTNNSTPSKHGFLPKLSNVATQFLNGQGNYATPAGVANTFISQSYSSVTSVVVTHNFGVRPVVNVIDGTGAVLVALSITHTSVNSFTVTFTAASSGTILATVGSPQAQAYIKVTDDYTTIEGDRFVEQTSAGKTITLLNATNITEQIIRNSSAGLLIVASAQLIDDELTQPLKAGEAMSAFFNGTTWRAF